MVQRSDAGEDARARADALQPGDRGPGVPALGSREGPNEAGAGRLAQGSARAPGGGCLTPCQRPPLPAGAAERRSPLSRWRWRGRSCGSRSPQAIRSRPAPSPWRPDRRGAPSSSSARATARSCAGRGWIVRLVRTHGGVENLERLRDPRSGRQCGLRRERTHQPGAVAGPRFARRDLARAALVALLPERDSGRQPPGRWPEAKGKRISIEPEGSATRSWPAGCSRSTAWRTRARAASAFHRRRAPTRCCEERSTGSRC